MIIEIEAESQLCIEVLKRKVEPQLHVKLRKREAESQLRVQISKHKARASVKDVEYQWHQGAWSILTPINLADTQIRPCQGLDPHLEHYCERTFKQGSQFMGIFDNQEKSSATTWNVLL